jgi:transposase
MELIIGLDISKSVFQVHGVNEPGEVVLKKRLRRAQLVAYFASLAPCRLGIEACGGAHHWARELARLGHEVKLLPPSYVKPYVKRGKNDALDAEAICEALQRPNMRFVPVKSREAQGALALHKVRDQLVRMRTKLVNLLRAHLSEFGIIAPQGIGKIGELKAVIADEGDDRLPALARQALAPVVRQLDEIAGDIKKLEVEIKALAKSQEASLRLATIPGVGPIIASAIVASVPDAKVFRSGRHFAAWLGLTPKQNASALKDRRGRISKMGNRYLRTLLVLGATSMVRQAQRTKTPEAPDDRQGTARPAPAFIARLLARKPARLVTVAYASKMARIIWALLAHGGTYRPATAR